MKYIYGNYQAFLVSRFLDGKKRHITFEEYLDIVEKKEKEKAMGKAPKKKS